MNVVGSFDYVTPADLQKLYEDGFEGYVDGDKKVVVVYDKP